MSSKSRSFEVEPPDLSCFTPNVMSKEPPLSAVALKMTPCLRGERSRTSGVVSVNELVANWWHAGGSTSKAPRFGRHTTVCPALPTS